MNDDEILRLLRAASAATIRAAVDRVKVPTQIPGTVLSFDPSSGVATVVVDGTDDPADAVEAENLTGRPLVADDRVMVEFRPPNGAFVSSRFGAAGGAIWLRGDNASSVTLASGAAGGTVSPLPLSSATFDGLPSLFAFVTSGGTAGAGCQPLYPGVYLVSGAASFAFNATGHRLADLQVYDSTGAALARVLGAMGPTTGDPSATTIHPVQSTPLRFNDGDYVSLRGRQASGGNLAVSATVFSMTWIAP